MQVNDGVPTKALPRGIYEAILRLLTEEEGLFTVREIASRIPCGERTVQRCLRQAMEQGEVTRLAGYIATNPRRKSCSRR